MDRVTLFLLGLLLIVGSGVFVLSFSFPSHVPENTTDLEKPEIFIPLVESTPSTISGKKEATDSADIRASSSLLPSSTVELSFHEVIASVFWIGESADAANAFISNDDSAWDTLWKEHYGGVDTPTDRCGFRPCGFTPGENPFYVALPYNDLDERGERKRSAENVPWHDLYRDAVSILKNRWVEVLYKEQTCYGQWEDVGPLMTDDFEYVFGEADPDNTFGVEAGIDLSPALRDCLHLKKNDAVLWRFISDTDVPSGPWREIITTSGVNW